MPFLNLSIPPIFTQLMNLLVILLRKKKKEPYLGTEFPPSPPPYEGLTSISYFFPPGHHQISPFLFQFLSAYKSAVISPILKKRISCDLISQINYYSTSLLLMEQKFWWSYRHLLSLISLFPFSLEPSTVNLWLLPLHQWLNLCPHLVWFTSKTEQSWSFSPPWKHIFHLVSKIIFSFTPTSQLLSFSLLCWLPLIP